MGEERIYFAPLLFSGSLFDPDLFLLCCVGCVLFSLAASCVYILNDIVDREKDRLHPKKIVIVSSSPQVRYPDYYGIDMESMDQFIAFIAAMDLLRERGLWHIVTDTYLACKEQLSLPKEQQVNAVKRIYEPFNDEEISARIAELLRPAGLEAELEIVYQTMEGLHTACPNHLGDWYFSGDYPTPGGTRRVNMAFIDYYEKNFNN